MNLGKKGDRNQNLEAMSSLFSAVLKVTTLSTHVASSLRVTSALVKEEAGKKIYLSIFSGVLICNQLVSFRNPCHNPEHFL